VPRRFRPRQPVASVPQVTAKGFLAAFAAEIGSPAPTSAEFDALLEVASTAAHTSERLAAPLACWMGGVSGMPATEVLAAAQRVAARAEAG